MPMVHNCNYDKTVLLGRLRSISWRLDQYQKDADTANHPLCKELYKDLEKDLDAYSKKLESAICGLAKEDKYTFCDEC
ncbi:hypothetical protein HY641_01140 [Candidatus Woesearchaeota archaeon]|nr:hypothetical protein [Candidatus Woesearchaeota archaeon]